MAHALLYFVLCLVWSAGAASPAATQPALQTNPRPPELRLGMSAALTGPAAQLGRQMRSGVLAALDEANRDGGIRGARLRLIALDDGYEPERTIPNMHRLIEEEDVLAVIGNVGSPTAVAAVPIANRSGTLFFGAYSGADVLRKQPPDRYVINYRASYAEETAAMVDALLEHTDIKPDQIAFFTQRDAYGDAGYTGGIAALERHGLDDHALIPHGRYERNTLAVENGLADILSTSNTPRAVIMVGAYGPCAEFVRVADEFGFRPLFLSVSFVGTQALAADLGPLADGIVITQVVPHPCAGQPICLEYEAALRASDPDAPATAVSFEGYIAGAILVKALRTLDGPITRESLVDALEALGCFDIGLDEPLTLDPTEHQASHRVWPTVICDGTVTPIEWRQLKTLAAESHR